MITRKALNQLELKEQFDYHSDGYLVRKSNGRSIGRKIGSKSSNNNYPTIMYKGKNYLLHRLIYCWHTGLEPSHVDHINQNKTDCRIENLRASSHGQNLHNQKVRSNSGYKGVHWNSTKNKYYASICHNNKTRHIGRFDCPIKAAEEYDKLAIELFGEYAVTNFTRPDQRLRTSVAQA